jgi:hypothetical protein
MPEKIFHGLQSLHFDTLTLNPTKVNWVERWSKEKIISIKRPTMWVSFVKDGKTQWGPHTMVFRNV